MFYSHGSGRSMLLFFLFSVSVCRLPMPAGFICTFLYYSYGQKQTIYSLTSFQSFIFLLSLSLSSSLAAVTTIRYDTVQNRDLQPVLFAILLFLQQMISVRREKFKMGIKWIDPQSFLSFILMASLAKYKVAMFSAGLIGNVFLVLCCLCCHWMLLVMLLLWNRFLC